MKKILFLLILFSVLVSACGPRIQQQALPTAIATPVDHPVSCTLYQLKSWKEWGKIPNGSFNDIMIYTDASYFTGTTGVTVDTLMRAKEIAAIKADNVNSPRSYDWAAGLPNGDLYLWRQAGRGSYVDYNVEVWWNRILTASSGTNPVRNRICISEIKNGFGRIVGIPYRSDGNYQLYFGYDFVNMKVYGTLSGEPWLYMMLIFQADTGFINSKDGSGMWVPITWFYKSDGLFTIPAWWYDFSVGTDVPPTPTPSPTPSPTPIPSPTPVPSKPFMCLKSTWPLALHERPGPTMSNIPLGQSVDPGGIMPIEGLLVNPEGEWAQVNPWTWFAVTLNPTTEHPMTRTFAVQTACP